MKQDAKGDAVVGYTGRGLVSNVLTLDPETKLEVLKWETLSAEGLKAGTNPLSIEVAQLAVSAPACDVVIEADGTVNLRKVIGAARSARGRRGAGRARPGRRGGAPLPRAPRTAPVPTGDEARHADPYRHADRPGRPHRDHRPVRQAELLRDLDGSRGSVTGLSSEAGTVAQLDLRGSLAGHSPLQITGSVNPLAAAAFADIKASFRDIDLPAFTPYAGKYAGYTIARGTLTMEVSYKLQDRRLEAQNRFLVDQFELGEKVESKDATKLPVKLAVSLLKDKNGLIDLDLPIEGSLDDPKFRISKVIWRDPQEPDREGRHVALRPPRQGLRRKGRGALDGGLRRRASTTLDEAATKKLDALAKALLDRPALRARGDGAVLGREGHGGAPAPPIRSEGEGAEARRPREGERGAGERRRRGRRREGVRGLAEEGLPAGEVPEAPERPRHREGPSRLRDGEPDAGEPLRVRRTTCASWRSLARTR